MGWKRDGDRIIIDLTQEQWEVLLYALGVATGTADDAPRWQIMMLDLVNAINEGNPQWRPYKAKEKK